MTVGAFMEEDGVLVASQDAAPAATREAGAAAQQDQGTADISRSNSMVLRGRTGAAFDPERVALELADLAHEALVSEATLTPKPGLVDARNNGSHKDMTLATFIASAEALRPLFPSFVAAGVASAFEPPSIALQPLRFHGLACEEAMNAATQGINTHKGGIFAFGLLLGAAGRCLGRGEGLTVLSLCSEVAELSRGLVKSELASNVKTANTAGEYIYRRYGLTGARGEAESGFGLVRNYALPAYFSAVGEGYNKETALLAALLDLLVVNRDTNLVSRGGMEGLFFVRREAQSLKQSGGARCIDFYDRLIAMDDALIARNLSPGGSADLLGVTVFLAHIAQMEKAGSVTTG